MFAEVCVDAEHVFGKSFRITDFFWDVRAPESRTVLSLTVTFALCFSIAPVPIFFEKIHVHFRFIIEHIRTFKIDIRLEGLKP